MGGAGGGWWGERGRGDSVLDSECGAPEGPLGSNAWETAGTQVQDCSTCGAGNGISAPVPCWYKLCMGGSCQACGPEMLAVSTLLASLPLPPCSK